MPPTKTTPYATKQLRQRLVNAGVDPQLFDVDAHVDRKLTQRENYQNIMALSNAKKKPRQYREERHLQSTLKGEFYQIGKSHTDIDKKMKAKMPGERRSASGHTYTERRMNRSDKPGRPV